MLTAARRAGRWEGWRPALLIGQTLVGRTLGLVGFGRIAQATARRARALGMRIAYHSRNRAPDSVAQALDAEYVPALDDLVARADVLSIHVPGGEATWHLIDADRLARMPSHAILINTARGAIIDEAALADALKAGRIAAAGLDGYEYEPAVNP